MYPVGWPLWTLLARLGVPLRFTLIVRFDPVARVFWAESPDLDGLVVEASTLQDLHREALLAADVLLELQLPTSRPPQTAHTPATGPECPAGNSIMKQAGIAHRF